MMSLGLLIPPPIAQVPEKGRESLQGGLVFGVIAGAEAVHPGYGFLSERSAFPKALAVAGITFIGPNPAAIDAMGDKIESKKAAAAAKVSTVPGYMGIIEDAN